MAHSRLPPEVDVRQVGPDRGETGGQWGLGSHALIAQVEGRRSDPQFRSVLERSLRDHRDLLGMLADT